MKKTITLMISLAVIAFVMLFIQATAQPVVITQWDFEGDVITPSIGSGTAANIGGTTFTFAAGNGGGRAWNTTTYPAQSTGSGTAGVEFMVSTLGYQNIVISWDHRSSGTGSRWYELRYTLNNGANWLSFDNNDGGLSPHDIFYPFTFDLSSIAGASDNPGFGIRIVSIFCPVAFNQNANISFGPNEAYMRSNAQATYPPEPGVGTGDYGTAGTSRFDNVTFTGEEITGSTPVKLAVISVNNGISPSANTPFSVVVQAQDANNVPSNVTQNTSIQLSKATGSGTLGGTLTATINAGSHTVTLDAITYNVAESGVSITATRTNGMVLTPGTSTPFQVLPKATHLAFAGVPTHGQAGTPLATFTVEARRPDNTVDVNFIGSITLSKATGPGNVTGTLVKETVAGVATFNDIIIDEAGTYTLLAVTATLTDATSPAINILGAPSLTSEIVPQFIQGLNGTNNSRVPYAYRVTFNNLIPNATYKFINQVVTSADTPTAGGAGNIIFVTESGDFIRTTSTGFVTPGQFGEFATNTSGSYTGWFVTEPTGNARFAPGNYVFMRIRLNDGAGGTAVQHFLTTADSIKVINFGNDNDPLQGSGVYGRHFSTGKNFAFLYDNVNGSGRPITGTFIESDGTSGGTTYPAFYQNLVDGIEGAWGAIVPNQLPNGIRRVEVRDKATGSILDGTTTVANGIWPYGSNTNNPTVGAEALLITPWPDFTANQMNIAPGATVQFTDLTLGNPSAWSWQFVGGTPGTSSLQNPSVIYYNTGEFDVTMTITTEFGTEVITKTEYINVNPLPWPEFSGTPTVVPIGEGVTFTDMSTGDPTSWVWTFEGGSPANFNGQNPPQVIYSAPGQYDVTLVVSNQWGSNTLTKTDYITTGYPPVVDFSANNTNIIEGQTVSFTDQTQYAPTTWAWEFEGGTPATSANQNPQVVFNTPGTFSVTLTATNQFGEGTLTKTAYIVVNPVGIRNPEVPQLILWPNPSNGLVNINLPKSVMLVRIYNLTGQMIMHSHLNQTNTNLDLSRLNKGVYIIEAAAGDGSVARTKLLLQ